VRPRSWPPELLLGLVTIALYLNQLAVTVYVLEVHDGDPEFIARHLPSGWFELWTPGWLIDLSSWWPAPGLLAPSVLVIPAFLELPFVLLAYLAVVRWVDAATYRRLATSPMLWAASGVWTLAFCVVEVELANPRTALDLVMRVVAAVVAPLVIGAAARREPAPARSGTTARALLIAGTGAAFLGYLVLVTYDTALLYNLGRLPAALPWAGAALFLLLAVRMAARSTPPGRGAVPDGVVDLLGATLRHLLVIFFVPALAIRYLMSYFGGVVAGAVLLLVVLVAATVQAMREIAGPERSRLVALTGLVAFVGAAVGVVAALAGPGDYVEAALGRGAVAGFVVVLVLGAVADRVLVRGDDVRSG